MLLGTRARTFYCVPSHTSRWQGGFAMARGDASTVHLQQLPSVCIGGANAGELVAHDICSGKRRTHAVRKCTMRAA